MPSPAVLSPVIIDGSKQFVPLESQKRVACREVLFAAIAPLVLSLDTRSPPFQVCPTPGAAAVANPAEMSRVWDGALVPAPTPEVISA